jgi:peptide/nickel transport system permease protein
LSGSLPRVVARLSLLYVALLVLAAVFSDLLASGAPLVMRHAGHISVLPAVVHDASAATAALHPSPGDWSVWPLLRAGRSAPHPWLAATVGGARDVVVTTGAVLAIALGLGVAGGMLAGAISPLTDALLARAVELSGALPTLILLAVARVAEGRPDAVTFVAIVGLTRAIRVARLVRGEALRVSAQDYVVAARALGLPAARLLKTHILPHVLEPAWVTAAFTAAAVVGLQAALGFVGLGPWPAGASWGSLVGLHPGAAVSLGPAAAIVLTTGALYVLGDALDSAQSKRHRALRLRSAAS